MKKVKPRLAGGFLDFGTSKYLVREQIIKKIDKVFRSFGYNPIETPIVEFLDVLAGEDETSKNIFHLQTGNQNFLDEKLALRFDHTVPFARFLALYPYNKKTSQGISLPWRRSVCGPVFRADKPQKGRYRQFYQFDIDIAGPKTSLADAEIISVIYFTMKKLLNNDNFKIKINDRFILNGLAEILNIKVGSEKSLQFIRTLDKIEKDGWLSVKEELSRVPVNEFDDSLQINEEGLNKLYNFLFILNSSAVNSNEEKLLQAKTLLKDSQLAQEGINKLDSILNYLSHTNVNLDNIEIDFSIARGLDYYTGPVFETEIKGMENYGSVFSGGRYDDLMKRFSSESIPAVGASIGVDRLMKVLEDMDILKYQGDYISDIMVLRLGDNKKIEHLSLQVAQTIRNIGYKVEMSMLEDLTFKSQFTHALSRLPNLKYMVIIGENEVSKRTLQIKDLASRKQVELNFDKNEIVNYFVNQKNQ